MGKYLELRVVKVDDTGVNPSDLTDDATVVASNKSTELTALYK